MSSARPTRAGVASSGVFAIATRAVAVVALAAASARAEPPAPVPATPPASAPVEQRRTIHLVALASATALYASSELLFKDALAADACRWCNPPGFDESVRNSLVWHDTATAARLSNFTGYAGVPLATAALFVFATSDISDHRAAELVDDAIPISEAIVYTQVVTQIVKFSVARERPFARFGTPALAPSNETNLSFFSGHSSLAFSVAVSAGVVAHRRRYALAPAIWITGLSLATATAYLRIAADRHL